MAAAGGLLGSLPYLAASGHTAPSVALTAAQVRRVVRAARRHVQLQLVSEVEHLLLMKHLFSTDDELSTRWVRRNGRQY